MRLDSRDRRIRLTVSVTPWKRRDKKLLKVFKRLGSFRKREKEFFKNADFTVNYIDDEICILERMTGERQLYLIINRSDHVVDISIHNTEPERTKIAFKTDKNEDTIHINSLEGMILSFSKYLTERREPKALSFLLLKILFRKF